jgi:hypothetical protein
MSDIVWPERYTPGTTDNYVSNEIIVAGLTAADVWPFLNNTSAWPNYYSNVSDIRFYDASGPELHPGVRFRFTTFSFPVEAEVTEYEPPAEGKPARLAWHGWVEGSPGDRIERPPRLAAGGPAWWPGADPHSGDANREARSGVGQGEAQPHAQRPSGMDRRTSSRCGS